MPQVEVKSHSSSDFKQEIQTGHHHLSADAPKAVGGDESAPDPHELLLGALGACTSITLQMYAKKKGWDLQEVKVKVTEEKVADDANPTQSISRISREISVHGNLAQDQVTALRAIADKCPIHKLLEGPKQISTAISQN
jgi:putative redox protein